MPLFGQVAGASGSQVDPGTQKVEDLLGKLGMDKAPQAPKAHPAQIILGSIGDALISAAAVRSGHAPGVGPFAAMMQRQQAEQAAREADFQAEQRRLVTGIEVGRMQAEEKGAADLAEEKRRNEHEKEMVEFRAAVQSEAEAATWMRQYIQNVNAEKRKMALDLISDGRLPATADPENMSFAQLLAAAGSPRKMDEAALKAMQGARAQFGDDAKVKGIFETGKPGRIEVEFTPDDVKALEGKPLTATAKANIAKLGIPVAGRPDDQILADVTKYGQDRSFKLPQDAEKGIRASIEGLAAVARLREMMTAFDEDGKPIPRDIFGVAPEGFPGPFTAFGGVGFGKFRTQRLAFDKTTANLADAFVRSRSGASTNEAEFERLGKVTPALGRLHDTNTASLNELETWFTTRIATIEGFHKIPKARLDALRREVEGVARGEFIVPEDAEMVMDLEDE